MMHIPTCKCKKLLVRDDDVFICVGCGAVAAEVEGQTRGWLRASTPGEAVTALERILKIQGVIP